MRILVTGGSGTLGRSLCRALKGDHEIVVYSRDHSRQLKFCQGCHHVVGDISDTIRLTGAMKEYAVDAVVHCAAIKHVDVCEKSPSLCFDSVVNGTRNVLNAVWSNNSCVKKTLVISSDKACNRNQVYGTAKYFTEKLVEEYSRWLDGKVHAVRFGNLLGSQGSVLPIWHELAKSNKDLQLRTFKGYPGLRFCMTPWHAVEFIRTVLTKGFDLNTGSTIFPTDIACLNMKTVAECLIEMNGSKCKIVESEAKAGEELLERMYTKDEAPFVWDREDKVSEIFSKKASNLYSEEKATKEPLLYGSTKLLVVKALEEMVSWTQTG